MRAPDWTIEGRDWPHRAASRFVTSGGLRWHVQIAGEGPVLLLLHGTGAATHSWRDLMPLLAKDFTVVAPDLPGHGFTRAADRPTLPRVAALIGGLLETLDQRPALVVGHSAGAAIALRVVLDAGGSTPIVSLAGALQPFPGIAARLFPAMAQMLFLNPLVPRLFALQARSGTEVSRFMLRSTGSAINARGLDLYRRLFGCAGHVAGALAMMAHWDLETFARDLGALEARVLLLHGSRDTAIPSASARAVATQLKHADAAIVDGLGHLLHEEAPVDIAERIVSFARSSGILGADKEHAI